MDYKEIYFPTIDSTNTYLKNHFFELDNFSIVRSDYQTKGKGREDRIWKSESGENLLFSILIKDKDLIRYGAFLSLVAAYSISESISKYCSKQLHPMIKWPNDIYVNDQKVCGILLEGRIPDCLIIGVGLNINQKVFTGEYRVPPTSLSLLLKKEVDFEKIKETVYSNLLSNLSNIDVFKDKFLEYYSQHDYLEGKKINTTYNHRMIKGVVKGVDDHFNLVIIDENNNEQVISSGEINCYDS